MELWPSENRELDGGRRLRSKGSYPITFHTLFVDIRLKSPRYYLPDLVGGNRPATISPLRKLIPDHIAPELLADVLPVGSGGNATTVRQHALQGTKRIERELTEKQVSFMQDACPRDWMNLPVPNGRIFIGLDGGYNPGPQRSKEELRTDRSVLSMATIAATAAYSGTRASRRNFRSFG